MPALWLPVLLSALVHATTPQQGRARASKRSITMTEESPFLNLINQLQETLQQSPLANFKAKLAQMQAGQYDQEAVAEKLATQIQQTPCIVYSFTTCEGQNNFIRAHYIQTRTFFFAHIPLF